MMHNFSFKYFSWATGWTIEVLGFDSRLGQGIFLFTTASRTALGPTQPPIQWLPEALSLGIKRTGREADHSPPSIAEVKEWVELYLHPQYAFTAWCSVKAQGELYLYLVYFYYRHCTYTFKLFVTSCVYKWVHRRHNRHIHFPNIDVFQQKKNWYYFHITLLFQNPNNCSWIVKVKLSLCLPKHHAMKTYWGRGGIAPRINLETRWRWVVSFTPWPLYPRRKNTRYPLDTRLGVPQSTNYKAVVGGRSERWITYEKF
jgi:hypothetical protein